MNEHVHELKKIIDEYKNKVNQAQDYAQNLEVMLQEQKIEIEVGRKRAEQAEIEVIEMRKKSYEDELSMTQLKMQVREEQQVSRKLILQQ